MSFNIDSPLKLLFISFVFLIQLSCSKDSDLLAELVISDSREAIIVDDFFVVSLEGSTVLDVLSNDNINQEEEVTITGASDPAFGTVEINPDNTITYTPKMTTSEATEPEATEPEATEPEATEPEATEPEATQDTFTYTTEVINPDESVSTETGSVTVALSENSGNDQSKGNGSLIWHTNFETDQWDLNPRGNEEKWEYEADRGVPRTISPGRDGTGRALRMGDYNGHITRNEVHRNDILSTGEHWIGLSMKIIKPIEHGRTYFQFRNRRPESDSSTDFVLNPLTLRQQGNNRLYFAMTTNRSEINTVATSGGASALTENYPKNPNGGIGFDYNLNEWIDIVIHWELDSIDGYVEIWVNGDKIVDVVGTTNYKFNPINGSPISGYLKQTIGVYWSKENKPEGEAHYDDFKIWKGPGTYEDVAPGRN